ncbi:hypothetical protein WJX84_003249 [Apatococcus fuscideae]|uniref:Uncharacterized protein n=1 Tax=Apatococcus fuscideae TaxID=2026836 RepID=A0AAW1RYT6_9CHLO
MRIGATNCRRPAHKSVGSARVIARHGQHVQMSIGRGDAPNQSSVANAQFDSQILALQQQANSPNCQDIPRLPL